MRTALIVATLSFSTCQPLAPTTTKEDCIYYADENGPLWTVCPSDGGTP